MISFTGQKIWLVGASVGIGEALAHVLAAKGAFVAVSARSHDKLDELVAALPGKGHIAVPLDVTQDAGMQTAWDQMLAQWGVPDMVIYNAGTYTPMSARKFDLAQAEAMVDVNFSGQLRMLARVLPAFLARGTGHIVLVGSVAGYSGLPNAIGYGASKAGVIHLAENLRADLADTDITVQLVSPGFVKTRLTEKNSFPMPFIISAEEAGQRIVRGIASGRFETGFPKRLYLALKFLRLLPYGIYFSLLKRMKIAG